MDRTVPVDLRLPLYITPPISLGTSVPEVEGKLSSNCKFVSSAFSPDTY